LRNAHMGSRMDGEDWLIERRWTTHNLPRCSTKPGARLPNELDLTAHLTRLCEDIALRSPDFAHLDTKRCLFTLTPSRNRSKYGLQARVTAMRCRGGSLERKHRGVPYRVQRYYVDGQEMLYLVTFCVPRFLNQSLDAKLVTIFHELFHISPEFNGDIRRLGGRYSAHSASKDHYDEAMARLATHYMARSPDPKLLEFLRFTDAEMVREFGAYSGVCLPQPKLVRVKQEPSPGAY